MGVQTCCVSIIAAFVGGNVRIAVSRQRIGTMPTRSLRDFVNNMEPLTTSTVLPTEQERRSALRIEVPFPAEVRGVDMEGKRFKTATVLRNLSPTHLYFSLAQRVEKGVRLFVVIRLSLASDGPSPFLAIHGRVIRVDQQPEGGNGIAIEFSRHRFLYAAPSIKE